MAGPAKKRTQAERRPMMDPAELARDKTIAKRGDVLLQPSKDGKPVGTLLVSSQVLSLASPVFEAMFNGNFAEGQDLSATSPRKVPLPEDDPEALILLCKVTHLQIDDVPDQVSFDKLADFAIVCDKYRCTTAVRPWSKVQIAQLLPKPNAPLFAKLIFITYVLDLPAEFEQVSLRMIRDRGSNFAYHDATHGTDFMPLIMIDYLRRVRDQASAAARRALWPKKYHALVNSDCARAGAVLKLYLSALTQAGIPLGEGLCLADYRSRAPILESQDINCSCAEHHDCAVTESKYMNKEVATALIKAYNEVTPCCLDCMRKRVCGKKDIVCRLGHVTPAASAVNTNSPP